MDTLYIYIYDKLAISARILFAVRRYVNKPSFIKIYYRFVYRYLNPFPDFFLKILVQMELIFILILKYAKYQCGKYATNVFWNYNNKIGVQFFKV